MKVTSGSSAGLAPAPGEAAPATAPAVAAPRAAETVASAPGSASLQPALDAARAAPGVDAGKLEELRDALSQGKLPFDAGRLADLIERYHRGLK